MKLIRKPLPQEEQLLETLIELTNLQFNENWKTNLLVAPMSDGGMGSLRLYPKGILDNHVFFGKQVSDYQFFDEDNVPVIASLNLDNHGDLYELDIWKTDFSPLIRLGSFH